MQQRERSHAAGKGGPATHLMCSSNKEAVKGKEPKLSGLHVMSVMRMTVICDCLIRQ